MPELPEVQTIINDLQSIIGDKFTGFFSDFAKAIMNVSAADLEKAIKNQKITSISRLGKIILIKLGSGKYITIHLKMTGKLLLMDRNDGAEILETKPKHLHHIFFLEKNGRLEFHDIRKFATIHLYDDKDISNIRENYGIDPISDVFSLEQFLILIKKSKTKSIKEILMNNSLILGIGNIYASEILYDAKIAPTRKGPSISDNEAKILHNSIIKILTKAIKLRGTSVSDYRDSRGMKGSFQNELKVYKKSGQKCGICATIIAKIAIGQRSTFYCPNCQK